MTASCQVALFELNLSKGQVALRQILTIFGYPKQNTLVAAP
jgi:hypothetical protein